VLRRRARSERCFPNSRAADNTRYVRRILRTIRPTWTSRMGLGWSRPACLRTRGPCSSRISIRGWRRRWRRGRVSDLRPWRASLRRGRDCARRALPTERPVNDRSRAAHGIRSSANPGRGRETVSQPNGSSDGRVWSPAFRPSGASAIGLRTALRPDSELFCSEGGRALRCGGGRLECPQGRGSFRSESRLGR